MNNAGQKLTCAAMGPEKLTNLKRLLEGTLKTMPDRTDDGDVRSIDEIVGPVVVRFDTQARVEQYSGTDLAQKQNNELLKMLESLVRDNITKFSTKAAVTRQLQSLLLQKMEVVVVRGGNGELIAFIAYMLDEVEAGRATDYIYQVRSSHPPAISHAPAPRSCLSRDHLRLSAIISATITTTAIAAITLTTTALTATGLDDATFAATTSAATTSASTLATAVTTLTTTASTLATFAIATTLATATALATLTTATALATLATATALATLATASTLAPATTLATASVAASAITAAAIITTTVTMSTLAIAGACGRACAQQGDRLCSRGGRRGGVAPRGR